MIYSLISEQIANVHVPSEHKSLGILFFLIPIFFLVLQTLFDFHTFPINLGIDPITKKRKQITKSGFPSKTAATDAAKELEFKNSRGEFVQDSNMTFQTLAEKWLESYATQAKASSVRARRKESNVLLKQWKNTQIKNINKAVYREYLNELSKGYSLNYMDGIQSTGRMIFKFAVESDWLQQNPTENYSLPKQQATIEDVEMENLRKKFLEKNELAEFISLARTEGLSNDYMLFSLLAYSGIWIGEVYIAYAKNKRFYPYNQNGRSGHEVI
jgi:hypothetical protein